MIYGTVLFRKSKLATSKCLYLWMLQSSSVSFSVCSDIIERIKFSYKKKGSIDGHYGVSEWQENTRVAR